ncbi:hypothetical protein [Collinsella stercoris]|uniref:hypothetical protein n=2 Tax=Collinsella stercoris TaxID=147206 RepID=UPI003996BFC8
MSDGKNSSMARAPQREKARSGVSRRTLFKGGAAATAALTVISLVGCDSDGEGSAVSGEPQVITDDSKIINVIDDFENVDNTLTPQLSWDVPLGTVPFHCEGAWAALLEAPASARAINTLGIISLASGSRATLVPEPIKGKTYGFHDVRCSEQVYAWIEMDYATGDWVLLAQELENGVLVGEPVELDDGTTDWEPARFTVTGNSVIWQKMPFASGAKRAEYSHCYLWSVGSPKGKDLHESPGRFATWPRVSDGYLTIAPRVNASEGTFYGLTALDLQNNNKVAAQLVMPETVSPFEAVYMGSSFAFSVEANYGYGGGLGNMGTFIGNAGGPFTYLSREPLACVAGNGTRYLIKAQSSHFVVDTEAQTYAVLAAPDKSLDFGDYPASEGTTDRFVTYATVRGDDGLPAAVQLRVFSL